MTITKNIPHELKALDRWVCVRSDSKRPFSALDGSPASSTDPTTWASFSDALCALRAGRCDYLGYVFADGDGVVGIDLDHCFDDMGMLSDEVIATIDACASYYELSRSGEGIHIIGYGDIPFSGANNRKGWEIYKSGRYFILTGNRPWDYRFNSIQDAIEDILTEHFADELKPAKTREARRDNIWHPIWGEAKDGLVPITADYPTITPGSRHISLVSFCGQYHTAGASAEMIREMARQVSKRCMKPPLDDDEIDQIVSSVTKYKR